MAVQELHGIFQFADDLFPAAAAEEVPILASYQAKAVFPKVCGPRMPANVHPLL